MVRGDGVGGGENRWDGGVGLLWQLSVDLL